jgi:hypothetical protein
MKQINVTEYPFAWLDEIVEVTLNPAITEVSAINLRQLENLRINFRHETRQMEAGLKAQTFGLHCKSGIQTVVEYHYLAIRELLQQAASNLETYNKDSLIEAGKDIKAILEASGERIRSRYQIYLPETLTKEVVLNSAMPNLLFKLLIRLSGDQIGILIRAAYEGHLIDATSKRAAYRALAPFLSTMYKEDLSDDSLRSNAGRPEDKDIDIVIDKLGHLMKIIRDYHRR